MDEKAQSLVDTEARRLGALAALSELLADLYAAHPEGKQLLANFNKRIRRIVDSDTKWRALPKSYWEGFDRQVEFVRKRVDGEG